MLSTPKSQVNQITSDSFLIYQDMLTKTCFPAVVSYANPSNNLSGNKFFAIRACTNFSVANSIGHFDDGANATDIPTKFDAYKIE